MEQFYEYSRISAEEYAPEIHQVDLGRILRETVLDSWKDIEQSGLELKLVDPERPVLIMGNENAAERIIRERIPMHLTSMPSVYIIAYGELLSTSIYKRQQNKG